MTPATFSAFWLDHLGSDWTHALFLVGTFIAEVAVGAGIIIESPKNKTCKDWLAIVLVVGGVSLSVLFTLALFMFDEGISSSQQSNIIDLETRLDARTKELLEVRKLTADRSLTQDEQKSLTKMLSVFPGQPAKIVIFPVTFEGKWIAGQIYGAMLKAQWKVASPERPIRPPNDFMVQGSVIDASDYDVSQRAADALYEALKSTGVPSGKMGNGPRTLQFDRSQPLVWMLIGDKPIPILDWIK
jgi:hypothetical protein